MFVILWVKWVSRIRRIRTEDDWKILSKKKKKKQRKKSSIYDENDQVVVGDFVYCVSTASFSPDFHFIFRHFYCNALVCWTICGPFSRYVFRITMAAVFVDHALPMRWNDSSPPQTLQSSSLNIALYFVHRFWIFFRDIEMYSHPSVYYTSSSAHTQMPNY